MFREPGFALPDVEVTLRATTPPPGVKHVKPQTVRANGRGEYAFHVPAGKGEYVISVKADGFTGDEKPVTIESEERVDIYFTLRAVK